MVSLREVLKSAFVMAALAMFRVGPSAQAHASQAGPVTAVA